MLLIEDQRSTTGPSTYSLGSGGVNKVTFCAGKGRKFRELVLTEPVLLYSNHVSARLLGVPVQGAP